MTPEEELRRRQLAALNPFALASEDAPQPTLPAFAESDQFAPADRRAARGFASDNDTRAQLARSMTTSAMPNSFRDPGAVRSPELPSDRREGVRGNLADFGERNLGMTRQQANVVFGASEDAGPISIADLTVLGTGIAALSAKENVAKGDYAGAAGEALGALPMIGATGRMLRGAGKVMPAVAAGGTAALASSEAEANPLTKAGQAVIRAFHSSPHKFDKFEWSPRTARTGEGGAAYGEGLYLAENPAVSGRGGQYWEQFARNKFAYSPTPEGMATRALLETKGDTEAALKKLSDPKYQTFLKDFLPNSYFKNVDPQDALKLLKSGQHVGPHTYEVGIRARPEDLLDWDKKIPHDPKNPLRDVLYDASRPQRESVYGDLRSAGNEAARQAQNPDLTGEGLYRQLAKVSGGDKTRASEILRDAGIPGHRFLDQGSRNTFNVAPDAVRAALAQSEKTLAEAKAAGDPRRIADWTSEVEARRLVLEKMKPTHNYVIWDPSKLDILKRYGVAGAAATGVGAAALAPQEAEAGWLNRPFRLPSRTLPKEPGELYHDVGQTKLQKPLSEYKATYEQSRPQAPMPERDLSEFKGRPLMAAPGDPSPTGQLLTGVGGKKFEMPVDTFGGSTFGGDVERNKGLIWASQQEAAERFQSGVDKAARETGREPLISYATMGPQANDYNTMMTSAIREAMRDAKVTDKRKATLSDLIREAYDPAFPGIDKMDDNWIRRIESGAARRNIPKILDSPKYRAQGFPDISELRHGLTLPELLHGEPGELGFALATPQVGAKISKVRRSFEEGGHPTYGADISGKMEGRLEGPLPLSIGMRGKMSGNWPIDYKRLTTRFPYQVIDDQMIDEAGSFYEMLRRRYGK